MTLSENIVDLRGRLQITQMQLAELHGVSFATVNRWKKGHHDATILVRRRFDDLCEQHGIIFHDKGDR
ncbi:MAG: helix-turn-helix domain-containing protein [Christensenellaceae bacterium]|nr:helix-turn-helix domain-containing protein [Christensenellaceae bacterium]